MEAGARTVVREPGWVWALVWVGFPLVGGGLGLLLAWIADEAAGIRWLPFRGVFELLDRFAGTTATIVAVAAGAALGLGLAVAGVLDRLTVTVDGAEARLHRGTTDGTVARRDTAAVFADGRQLRRELARIGVVVKDERKRQYIRTVPGS